MVVVVPTGKAFDRVEAIAQDQRHAGVEGPDPQIAVGRVRISFVDRPIEAIHPVVALNAGALHHDVVAVFGVVVGVVALTVHDIMADDGRVEEQLGVLAGNDIEAFVAFDPIVTFIAQKEVVRRAAQNPVVAGSCKDLGGVGDAHEEVVAFAAEQEVEAVTVDDHVVACFAAQEIVTEGIFDDVIAFTAKHLVGFHSGVEIIVAGIAPERIDALVAV